MAGGEGTRLRPMTANQPKPLLPVVNKPIMEHVLLLLKRHGFTETVVTVQFLASLVRNYFGDGEDVGMSLQYATEEMPLGTAGSVKNAEDELRADPFLVISGDALTDIDLSALVRYHKDNSALVTVALTRVPNPLEFGIIIVDEDGRIQRFLEKPTWGQVFSDTVNTGIYVMEPEVLAEVPAGVSVDWSGDVFPQLLKSGAPLYGWIADGYWEDVGSHESYLKAQADVLSGRVEAEIGGFEVSPGVWIREGAEVDPEALLSGPLCIGDYAKIEAGAQLREFTVVGSNVVVKEGAFLHRAVVHNNVYVGQGTTLRGCVIGKNTDVMGSARIEEGAVIGDECVIEPEAYVSAGVKVYPFKTIEAGAVVNTSVIWESRGQRTLFGPRGVSGLINVEITPELCVRLASAYATLQEHTKIIAFEPHLHAPGVRMCLEAIWGHNIQTLNCVGYDHNWVKQYVYDDDAAPLLPKGTIVHLIGFLDTTAANKNPADPRNWAGGGRRSIANMFIDLGYSVSLTEEQFQAEMAKRRANMKSRNDYDIGCPLCWAPPVQATPATTTRAPVQQ